MQDVFKIADYHFPYTELKFPGQATDERILFITREAPVMLTLRLAFVILVALTLLVISWLVSGFFTTIFGSTVTVARVMLVFVGLLFLGIGIWWVRELWQKSLFILTSRRLTKFIYTTPWNRYNLSVTLDNIEDTGAYSRGYFEALFKVGTLAARSGAGNRPEKYFYVNHIHAAEDLANYINKVLFEFRQDAAKLETFRPFIPELKGEARKRFMEKYPQYWS